MKKAIFRLMIGTLAVAFLAAAQIARAQEAILVNIPFAFNAGRMTLPAGEYRVEKQARGSLVLLIQRTDRSAATFVSSFAAMASAPQTESKLIFHRYGERYFLSQVWIAGYFQGRQLPQSTQEKEQVLARNETRDQVTIVARLAPSKP